MVRATAIAGTPNVERLYTSEADVEVEGAQHKALADQLATVAKRRLQRRMGHLPRDDVAGVERSMRVLLGVGELPDACDRRVRA